jgi:type I restriction enzyme M protein
MERSVLIEPVADNGYNLDLKNPNAKQDFEHLPPEQLAEDILQKERRLAEIRREIQGQLGQKP